MKKIFIVVLLFFLFCNSIQSKINKRLDINLLLISLNDDNTASDISLNADSDIKRLESKEIVERLFNYYIDGIIKNTDSLIIAIGNSRLKKYIPFLIDLLKNGADNIKKELAAKALGQLKSEVATKDLILLLKEEDSNVRRESAYALGEIGNEDAVDPLMSLQDDKSFEVRIAAIQALGKIGSNKVVEHLMDHINDQDIYVRIEALHALRNFDEDLVINELIKKVDDVNEKSKVRSFAAILLSHKKTNLSAKTFLNNLESKYLDLQAASIFALAKIKSKESQEELLKKLKDNEWLIREFSIYALNNILKKSEFDEIVHSLKNASNYSSNNICIYNHIDDYTIEEIFNLVLLLNSDSEIRGQAAHDLGELKTEGADCIISKLLNDKKWTDEKVLLITLLGEYGSKNSADILIDFLDDSDYLVRSIAIRSLGSMRCKKAEDKLLTMLESKNNSNVSFSEIVWSLGEIGSVDSIKIIKKFVPSQSRRLRRAAIVALGKIKSKDSLEVLIKSLDASDSFTIPYSIWALEEIGSNESVVPLSKLLKHKNHNFRFWTVNALAKIGSPMAGEYIIKALKDKKKVVRATAAYALGKMKYKNAIKYLIQAKKLEKEWIVNKYLDESLKILESDYHTLMH